MATTQVRLPRRQFASRDKSLLLTTTATAELVWWPADAAVLGPCASADRVLQLVRAGRLWLGTGGSAVGLLVYPTIGRGQVVIDSGDRAGREDRDDRVGRVGGGNRGDRAGKGDKGNSGTNISKNLCDLIVDSSLWDDTGLEVDRDHSERWRVGRRRDAGRLYFAVRQPMASSSSSSRGLCAPEGIPRAQFRKVFCHLNFTVVEDPQKRKKKTSSPKPKTPACEVFHDEELWRKAAALVETSLRDLVGVRRRLPYGVVPAENRKGVSPSLMDIAPAVWSHHYFQEVSSRQAYLPLLGRILASCTAAQGPSLRRKAEALVAADSTRGLQAKLQDVVLRRIPVLPSRVRKKFKARKKPPVRPQKQQETWTCETNSELFMSQSTADEERISDATVCRPLDAETMKLNDSLPDDSLPLEDEGNVWQDLNWDDMECWGDCSDMTEETCYTDEGDDEAPWQDLGWDDMDYWDDMHGMDDGLEIEESDDHWQDVEEDQLEAWSTQALGICEGDAGCYFGEEPEMEYMDLDMDILDGICDQMMVECY